METTNRNELTDEQLDTIVEALSEKNEDVLDIRDIEVEVDENAELEVGVAREDAAFAEVIDSNPTNEAKYDIFTEELTKGEFDTSYFESLGIEDSEVLKFLDIANHIDDEEYSVMQNLPEQFKAQIMETAIANGFIPAKTESFARALVSDMIRELNINRELIDLEKSIDEALMIPSIADLYSEHTSEVMNEIIPKTIESIKDEHPDKAEKLQAVRDAFNKSYEMEVFREAYLENNRIRKAVRRFDIEFKRMMDKFNYTNEKSNFKMNDVYDAYDALIGFFKDDDTVTEVDVKKMFVLITKYCETMHGEDLIDSTFMYYMMRNIIILKHSNEVKTPFSVELINNIRKTIEFIRTEEDKFNETSMDKSKSAKKRSGKKRI